MKGFRYLYCMLNGTLMTSRLLNKHLEKTVVLSWKLRDLPTCPQYLLLQVLMISSSTC